MRSMRVLVAVALLHCSATVCEVRAAAAQPSIETWAGRLQLRWIEHRAVGRLRHSHGDPAIGASVGQALRRYSDIRLPHPSEGMHAALAAAADPAALALALAGRVGDVTRPAAYEVELLVAVTELPAAAPRRAALWTRAAEIEPDNVLRLAFLAPAAALLPCGAGTTVAAGSASAAMGAPATATADGTDGCQVAAKEIDLLLQAGLAREAAATYDALPPKGRERLLSAWADCDDGISLAAAHWLAGDLAGARAVRARLTAQPWPGGDWRTDQDKGGSLYLALLDQGLAPPASYDPFPVLAGYMYKDVFALRDARGTGLSVFARVASAERYPDFAVLAWSDAAADADALATGGGSRHLPAAARQAAATLRASLAQLSAAARTGVDAARKEAQHHPRPEVRGEGAAERIDLSPDLDLFAVNRGGDDGIALSHRSDLDGYVFGFKSLRGTLQAIVISSWEE